MQRDRRPIDIYLRMPSQSALVVELTSDDAEESLRVSIASDDVVRAFTPPPGSSRVWRLPLSEFDGEVVRVRFENRSRDVRPIDWGRPRVVGSAEPMAPVL